MRREDAERRAAELNVEHPDRGMSRWRAHNGEEGWQVARIAVPGGVRLDPLRQSVEANLRPDGAHDTRPAFFRDVGGPSAGG